MNVLPWPKIFLRPSIKTLFIFYKSESKRHCSQTFIYGCDCGAVVVVQVMLVILLVTLRREVQTVVTPAENRVRVAVLVSVPFHMVCAGVYLVPQTGQASLLSNGAASCARRDHVSMVPSNAYCNTPNV